MITKEEINRLIEAASPKLRLAIILSSECGLRLGEIIALTPEDIDLDNREINVDKIATFHDGEWKLEDNITMKHRKVDMTDDVIAEIGRVGLLNDCSPLAIRGQYRKLTRELGIDSKFHDLRKYYLNSDPGHLEELVTFKEV